MAQPEGAFPLKILQAVKRTPGHCTTRRDLRDATYATARLANRRISRSERSCAASNVRARVPSRTHVRKQRRVSARTSSSAVGGESSCAMMSACAVGARSPVARLPRSVGSTRAGRRACVDVRASNAPKPGAKNKKVRRASPDRASAHHRARTLFPNRGTRSARGNPALLPNEGPRRHPRPYVRCRARTF